MFINLVGLFQVSNICQVSYTALFKDSQTNVIDLEGTCSFLRGGGPALRIVSIFKRGTFFKRGPVGGRTPLLSARLPQRVSTLSPRSWFVPAAKPHDGDEGLSCLQLCRPLTNALPLCEGVPMASREQDYLFLTFLKTIPNSFCDPIERA